VLSIARSRALTALRSLFTDPLYRGSLIMLGNSAGLAIFGFVFWLVATHIYSAPAVGAYASITAGTGLLSAITLLGLPNTITRRIATATNPRQLMRVALTVAAVIGGLLCLATILLIGPHLPAQLSLGQRGPTALLLTGIVIATAVSTILDAALVATRATPALAIKNLIGSVIKIVVLVVLARMGSAGLILAYGLGISLSSVLSGLALWRRLDRGGERISPVRLLKSHMSMTAGNYASTIMGILPSTVVPIEVLIILGAAATGRFAVAFTVAGFLNVIPSTIGQVLFAETSRRGVTMGTQLRKAMRGTYGLLLPPLVVLMAGAPLVLGLFGATYALTATACLRVLLLSAVFTGGTYLVDSVLIARDRIVAYTFMNGANAALVLGGVALLLPHGLTAGAWGWTAAQGLSLLLGLAVIATGRSGRHRAVAGGTDSGRPASATVPSLPGGPDDRIGGELPQPQAADHRFIERVQQEDGVSRLEIAGLGPRDPRLHAREPGRAELVLQRLRVAVVVVHGKFHVAAGPGHHQVDEPDEGAEREEPCRHPEQRVTARYEVDRHPTGLEHPRHVPDRRGHALDVLEQRAGEDEIDGTIRHRQARRNISDARLGDVPVQREFGGRDVDGDELHASWRLDRPRVDAPAAAAEVKHGRPIGKRPDERVRLALESLPQCLVGRQPEAFLGRPGPADISIDEFAQSHDAPSSYGRSADIGRAASAWH